MVHKHVNYRGFSDLDSCWICVMAGKEGWPDMIEDHVLFKAPSWFGPLLMFGRVYHYELELDIVSPRADLGNINS